MSTGHRTDLGLGGSDPSVVWCETFVSRQGEGPLAGQRAAFVRFSFAPVGVIPEGTTEDQVLERARGLVDPVLERGWHFSLRLHTLLWGDRRGR